MGLCGVSSGCLGMGTAPTPHLGADFWEDPIAGPWPGGGVLGCLRVQAAFLRPIMSHRHGLTKAVCSLINVAGG